jgi:hypothetical protein
VFVSRLLIYQQNRSQSHDLDVGQAEELARGLLAACARPPAHATRYISLDGRYGDTPTRLKTMMYRIRTRYPALPCYRYNTLPPPVIPHSGSFIDLPAPPTLPRSLYSARIHSFPLRITYLRTHTHIGVDAHLRPRWFFPHFARTTPQRILSLYLLLVRFGSHTYFWSRSFFGGPYTARFCGSNPTHCAAIIMNWAPYIMTLVFNFYLPSYYVPLSFTFHFSDHGMDA